MSDTVEGSEAELVKSFLDEAHRLQKKHGLNKAEALVILELLELKKIHSHLDSQ